MGEKKIVILGAGFGGLRTALRLDKKLKNNPEYKIVLVDKNSYQTYTPSLYEVATAYKGGDSGKYPTEEGFKEDLGGSATFSVREVISGTGIEFVQERIKDIKLSSKMVIFDSGDYMQYEYCVVGLGAQIAFYDVEGAEMCCNSLKTLEDAMNVRNAIINVFESAEKNDRRELNFTIIGAGLSGFEVATELAVYVEHLIGNNFDVERKNVNIKLLDAGPKVLPQVPAPMRKAAKKRLTDLGIETITEARVTKIEPHKIHLKNGDEYSVDFMLWSAGVKGLDLYQNIEGLPLHKSGRIIADNFLRIEGEDNTFVLGDAAFVYYNKTDTTVPATAWAAEQEADVVSDNIYNAIYSNPFREYNPKFPGYVSSAGGKYGIAHLYGITVKGFIAWGIKRLIDLKYILSIYMHKPFRGIAIWIKGMRVFGRND